VVRISGEESFAGKPIRTGGIRGRLHCMVLGLQKQNYTTLIPDPNMVIQAGDLLWVIGANNDIGRLISS
jgi:CPA2 family monovalent cation:H+ antiporter-2